MLNAKKQAVIIIRLTPGYLPTLNGLPILRPVQKYQTAICLLLILHIEQNLNGFQFSFLNLPEVNAIFSFYIK